MSWYIFVVIVNDYKGINPSFCSIATDVPRHLLIVFTSYMLTDDTQMLPLCLNFVQALDLSLVVRSSWWAKRVMSVAIDQIVLGIPECIPIRPPANGNITCTEDNDEYTCTPYCLFNYQFSAQVAHNYSCGPSTHYLWTNQENVQQDVMILPGCSCKLHFYFFVSECYIYIRKIYPACKTVK